MYEENRNQEFDGSGNPENHRSEERVPNFIMTDTQSQSEGQSQTESVSQNVQSQPHGEGQIQGQESHIQARNQPENNGQVQEPENHGQARSQSENYSQAQNQPENNGQARSQSENYSQAQGQPGNYSQTPSQSETYSQIQSQPESRAQGIQPQPQAYSGQQSQTAGSLNGQTYSANSNQNGAGNGGYYQQGQNGSFYHNGPTYQQMSGSQAGQPQDETGNGARMKKSKKPRGLFSKAAGITAAALLFGTVSGGTMVGINMLADSMKEEAYPQVSQSAILEGTAPAVDVPGSSGSGTSQAGSALAMDVSTIVENAMPSIVAINNTMLYQSNSWFGQKQTYEVPSSGSGIIVGQNDEELLVVTNNHVVEDSNSLSVVFIDSTTVNAAVKGTDAESDLAVVAIPLSEIPTDTFSQITVAKLGNSDEMKVGQCVIAIGNALGYGQSTTVGWVSALDREVTTDGGATTRNLLQTDAAINPGNSGGALLNMKGEVIGINAAKYSSTEVEGIGYAIPISKAEDIINSLMTKRTRSAAVEEGKEGYLGIQGFTVEDSMVKQLGMPSGVFVSGIIEGGAASKTDLREKDVITKFDDQTVRTMSALQDMLKYYKEGETVTMVVQSLENGQYVERTIEITLGGRSTLGEDR